MSRNSASVSAIKAHNTISTRKPPVDNTHKHENPNYEPQIRRRTYVQDPKYMKNGVDIVEIIGQLPRPPRFVVRKTKARRKARRRRETTPALPTHSAATMAYVRTVRETFWNRPEVFHEFVAIMAELSAADPTTTPHMVELIERVVVLFDGYPQLVFSFDAFLPEKYELELQDDAVVVKVYDDWEDSLEGPPDDKDVNDDNECLPTKTFNVETPRTRKNIDETVEYLKGVKKVFRNKPDVYIAFTDILHDFHTRTCDELTTIRKVVRLFRGHANLVLGFNEFLPKGFRIHMYDTSKYTIEFRNRDGDACTANIGLVG